MMGLLRPPLEPLEPLDVDVNGWARGLVEPPPLEASWMLLSPEIDARIDAARWVHQATTFFGLDLWVVPDKRYPTGAVPLADHVDVELLRSRVRVVTLPVERVAGAMARGRAAAQAIGGAGFDAILPRTRRVWLVSDRSDATTDGPADPAAPLAFVAVLASLLLAPIVPPEGGAIFGVKGARDRLSALRARHDSG